MDIENIASLRNIINQQNKLIEFLYKEQAEHAEQINNQKEQLETIFNSIAELYDIIDEWETDYNFILDELARIQNYSKTE